MSWINYTIEYYIIAQRFDGRKFSVDCCPQHFYIEIGLAASHSKSVRIKIGGG